MFEKYDGLRAFWNPRRWNFYSRFGDPLLVPHCILATMPKDQFLDGEIWYLLVFFFFFAGTFPLPFFCLKEGTKHNRGHLVKGRVR